MTTPAPEPVEVPADELAAAERTEAERVIRRVRFNVEFQVHLDAVLADLDQLRTRVERQAVDMCQVAHGASRMREENEAARRMLADERAANESYRADLARALPVVEAAGALVEHWDNAETPCLDYVGRNADLLDALARAYRAARGEQP